MGHLPDQFASLFDPVRELLFLWQELLAEFLSILFEGEVAFHDEHAFARLTDADNIHRKSKAIQKLRAEFPFFWIHRSDENETGWMNEGDALTFNHVHAHCRRVKQDVHNVIVEQVYLIDVEQAAVRARQDTRFEV